MTDRFVQTFCWGFPHPPKQMINIKTNIFKVFQNQVWNVSGTRCQFSLGYKQCKQARKTARRRGSWVCSASETQEAKLGAPGPCLQTSWRVVEDSCTARDNQASLVEPRVILGRFRGKKFSQWKWWNTGIEAVSFWSLAKNNWPIATWCFFEVSSTVSKGLA